MVFKTISLLSKQLYFCHESTHRLELRILFVNLLNETSNITVSIVGLDQIRFTNPQIKIPIKISPPLVSIEDTVLKVQKDKDEFWVLNVSRFSKSDIGDQIDAKIKEENRLLKAELEKYRLQMSILKEVNFNTHDQSVQTEQADDNGGESSQEEVIGFDGLSDPSSEEVAGFSKNTVKKKKKKKKKKK